MTSPLTPAEDAALVAAIGEAERQTSGEIRVHLEDTCPTPEPLDRAAQVFAELNMHKTAARNGVLFYLAWKSRQFAVVGDAAINAAVPDDFWETTKETVLEHFRGEKYVAGLGRLLAVSENYPDLKANANFQELQAQIEGTENRINVERNKFNAVTNDYNTFTRSFPNNLFAGMFGFPPKPYFEADPAASKAPTVQF